MSIQKHPSKRQEAPPVGEEIHLPGPSLIPLVNAIGLALVILGLAVSLILTAIGGVIFLLSAIRWIRDTRQSIQELPEPAKH